jgi:integrase/recombinase XerD
MVRTVWARVERARRLYLVNDQCDFVEPVKLYLDHLTALEKSPNTLENYCRHLCRYFVFLQREQLDWSSAKPDDLVHFVQWLRSLRNGPDTGRRNESRLSERTVNTIVTAVSSFYRYHIQRGSQLDNPVLYEQIANRFSGFKRFLVHLSHGRAVKRSVKLKEPQRRIKTVRDTDFLRFFSSTENLQFKCIMLLMREGGLRIGEVLGLWLQDLEFHRNGVRVRRRSDLDNHALAKSMLEGEERFVDLSPSLMALLDQLVLMHTFDTDHVFVVLKKTARDKRGRITYGRPLNRHAVKAMFRHYSRKIQLPLHAHMLRHTHATELIRAGWDVSYVRKRLGHAQVQSTMFYVHLDEEDMGKKWRHFQEKRRDESNDPDRVSDSAETHKTTMALLDPASR